MPQSFGQKSLVKGNLPGRDAIVETDMYHSMAASRSPMAGTTGTRTLSATANAGSSTLGRSLGRSTRNASTTLIPTLPSSTMTKVQPLADSGVVNRFPEKPTSAQKHRLVFEELDLHNTKTIQSDDFCRVFKALALGFNNETTDDLYQRMDVEKKDQVSFPAFLDWAEKYPNVINAIYYRSREMIERARREANIDGVRAQLEETQRAERLAQQQWEVANDALLQKQKQVEIAKDLHQDRIQAEKDRSAEVFDVSRHCEMAKTDKNAKELEYQQAKEHERAAFKPVADVQYQISTVESGVESIENAVLVAQENERRLEAELEEAKKKTGALASQLNGCTDELEELKSREKEFMTAHEEIARDAESIQNGLKTAEEEYIQLNDQKNASVKAQQDAAAAIKQALSQLEEEERTVAPIRQRENHHKDLKVDAQKNLDEADQVLRDTEEELNNYIAFRNQTELDEYPTLEQEVRLCEQRYNLDERDEHHFDQSTALINALNRTDTRAKTSTR